MLKRRKPSPTGTDYRNITRQRPPGTPRCCRARHPCSGPRPGSVCRHRPTGRRPDEASRPCHVGLGHECASSTKPSLPADTPAIADRVAWARVLSREGEYLSDSGSLRMCRRPVKDYPGSYAELLTWSPGQAACLDDLGGCAGRTGCAARGEWSRAGWRLSSGRWECAVCGRQVSVDCGDDLSPHSDAAAVVVRSGVGDDQPEARRLRAGDPAVAGARLRTRAWAMLHRYRMAMVRPGRSVLAARSRSTRPPPGGVEGAAVFGRA